MEKIPLKKGGFALVDDEDAKAVKCLKWYKDAKGYAVYSERMGEKSIKIYMHRFVMNPNKELHVDHVNSNRLDNRRSNLLICTNRENAEATYRRRR